MYTQIEQQVRLDIINKMFSLANQKTKYDSLSKFYEEIKWMKSISWTERQHTSWMDWGVEHLSSRLNWDTKKAQEQMCWLDYNYGFAVRG